MQVHVLFFGVLRELAGRGADSLTLPDDANLTDLLGYYALRIPLSKEMIASLAVSVNQEYATPDTKLQPDDEIALLPPVSGGTQQQPGSAPGTPGAMLVREPIDGQQVTARIKQPADGAVVVFDGIVRNHSRGRRTLFLEYEAYEGMAVRQMEALISQALAQFEIRDAFIVHRLGRIEIGESSVMIAVASAHRAAAFEACRWLIDTLKRTVPIWKKEVFEDGAVWADGEPFPLEVPRAPGSPAGARASK
jgi:molybdopterin synthase catalytic subunit/molybdopterin converting factor small subunit